MSKKARAKTGPREEAGKKSRPMDASEAVVRLRVGRTGLASLLFAVLRPKDARAAAVNPNALRLTHGSRYTKIPLGDIVAVKVKTGWHWYGIRFRHAAGEAFVSGLSRDNARAFAEALVVDVLDEVRRDGCAPLGEQQFEVHCGSPVQAWIADAECVGAWTGGMAR